MVKKRTLVGGLVILVALAALTFVLGQSLLFSGQARAQAPSGPPERVMVIAVEKNENGQVTSGQVQVRFQDPGALPDMQEAAVGLFLSQEGDSLRLGTGAIEVEVSVEVVNDEEPTTVVNARHSGEEITVVVGEGTVIYEDTTDRPEITSADIEAGEVIVLRTITPGSLEGLAANMIVRVWGTWQGDILLATTLVYEPIR
jgi:hypothetical protein